MKVSRIGHGMAKIAPVGPESSFRIVERVKSAVLCIGGQPLLIVTVLPTPVIEYEIPYRTGKF